EEPFDPGAVHPAGGARVPGPSSAADVRVLGVDVGRGDIGLHLVAIDARARARPVDRVQDGEELVRLVAVPQRGEGHHGPDRGMRVLAAIFANAWRIASYVARIERAVEGRSEQEHQ